MKDFLAPTNGKLAASNRAVVILLTKRLIAKLTDSTPRKNHKSDAKLCSSLLGIINNARTSRPKWGAGGKSLPLGGPDWYSGVHRTSIHVLAAVRH